MRGAAPQDRVTAGKKRSGTSDVSPAKQDSEAGSPDIIFEGQCSTPGEGSHGRRDQPEGGGANNFIWHIKSIECSSLLTECMPADVRHVNAARVMQQQVRADNRPSHTPKGRRGQDTTQGCIPLEPTAQDTLAGLCSGRNPMVLRDVHSKDWANTRGALTAQRSFAHHARITYPRSIPRNVARAQLGQTQGTWPLRGPH